MRHFTLINNNARITFHSRHENCSFAQLFLVHKLNHRLISATRVDKKIYPPSRCCFHLLLIISRMELRSGDDLSKDRFYSMLGCCNHSANNLRRENSWQNKQIWKAKRREGWLQSASTIRERFSRHSSLSLAREFFVSAQFKRYR